MRSLVLVPAFLILATSSPAADSPKPLPKRLPKALDLNESHCSAVAELWLGETQKPRKLTELPPAKAYHAVFRSPDLNGCSEPLYVGYQYSSKPKRR